MARKELFLKPGSYFYSDPKTQNENIKNGWFRKIMAKLLRQMGVPVVDPCCDPLPNVPVSWNTETSTLQAWVNGAWVSVETAGGAATTTSTSTTTIV